MTTEKKKKKTYHANEFDKQMAQRNKEFKAKKREQEMNDRLLREAWEKFEMLKAS